MQKQFNVSVCLEELHHSMKSLLLEGALYSLLLSKFSQQEINACLPAQLLAFLDGFEGAAAEEAQRFCRSFCEDLVANQQADCEDMTRLRARITHFQTQYESSRTSIGRKTEYACPSCHTPYSTENGLHNHLTKNNCTGVRRGEEPHPKRRRGRGRGRGRGKGRGRGRGRKASHE